MTNAFAAAIAILAVMPSAIFEGIICTHAVDGISRNPEAYKKIRTSMMLGCALTETTALYALIIAFMIIFAAK